jgi:HEAT repeat protein
LAARLAAKLAGPSAEVAAATATALAVLAPEQACEALAAQLRDGDRPRAVRSAAARALAGIATYTATAALAEAATDRDRQLRLDALAGLARIAARRDGPLAALEVLISALRRGLAPPPEAAIEPAAPNDAEPDAATEDAAGDRPAAWPTSTLAAITGQDARAVAAPTGGGEVELAEEDLEYLALTKRLPRKKRVALEPGIAVHEDVPRVAARMLGDVANEDSARALGAALRDGDLELRRIAADSLARIGERMGGLSGEVRAALRSVRADSDRDLRLAVARALGHAGDAAAAPDLVTMLDDPDGFVRAEAARSLGRLGAVGAEVEGLLADDEAGVRLAAAEAIAAQAAPNAVQRLVDHAFAFNGYHRREAARLLRRLDRAAASGRFIEVLNDPAQGAAWPVAIEALDELHAQDPTRVSPTDRANRVAA